MKRQSCRGMTLLEMSISAGLVASVMAVATGIYVAGTRSFHQDQNAAYMLFRTRSAIDRMAIEARGAKTCVATATIAGKTFVTHDGSDPTKDPCLVFKVPSLDANGPFYHDGTDNPSDPDDYPFSPVMDTIAYRWSRSDKTLRCSVNASHSVVTSDGTTRSSYRADENERVVAYNVKNFRTVFRDRDGAATTTAARIADVDLTVELNQPASGPAQNVITISGVRLRNMRSGSVPGVARKNGQPVANAVVTATFTSPSGAYATGAVVGSTTTDASGNFELYGLEEGSYEITVTASPSRIAKVPGVNVLKEKAATSLTVNVP